jgi:hypothetical protein
MSPFVVPHFTSEISSLVFMLLSAMVGVVFLDFFRLARDQ